MVLPEAQILTSLGFTNKCLKKEFMAVDSFNFSVSDFFPSDKQALKCCSSPTLRFFRIQLGKIFKYY